MPILMNYRKKPLMTKKKPKSYTKAKVIDKEVHKVLNKMHLYKPESKYFETSLDQACAVNGAFTKIATLVQGTDEFNRVGDKIHLLRIEVEFRFTCTVNDTVTLGLILDKEPNGALPVSVYEQAGQNVSVLNSPFNSEPTFPYLMMKNVNSQHEYRYGPIRKITHNLQVAGATEAFGKGKIVWNFKKSPVVEFNSTSGGITEAVKNYPLFFLAGLITSSMKGYARIFYTDD